MFIEFAPRCQMHNCSKPATHPKVQQEATASFERFEWKIIEILRTGRNTNVLCKFKITK
jgi:hypothetical protein